MFIVRKQGLIERKFPHDGIESFYIFALRERKHVVLTKSPAINGKAESIATKVLIEFDCLVFGHGDEHLIAVLHD